MTEPAAPHETEHVAAAERLDWLARNLRLWILALLLVLISTFVAVTYTYGLFSSTSANPRNTATAGSMTQDNTADDAAILAAHDLVPGQTAQGMATITNVGDAAGVFTLSGEDVVDVPGPNGGHLSQVLDVSIVEAPGDTVVYSGPVAAFDTVSLGTWQPDEQRSYDITVSLPGGAGNRYQGSEASMTFVWDAVQSH